MCDGCTAILTGSAITTCFLPRTLTVAQLAKSSARVVSIVGKDRVNTGLLLVSETHVLVSHDRGVAQTRNHRAVLPRLNPVIEERHRPMPRTTPGHSTRACASVFPQRTHAWNGCAKQSRMQWSLSPSPRDLVMFKTIVPDCISRRIFSVNCHGQAAHPRQSNAGTRSPPATTKWNVSLNSESSSGQDSSENPRPAVSFQLGPLSPSSRAAPGSDSGDAACSSSWPRSDGSAHA